MLARLWLQLAVDDVILGFELNYGHTNLHRSASDSLSRSFINNAAAPPDHTYQYNITVAGSAAIQITDLMTFRLRGGWVVDNLLPYAFVGPAIGRANVVRSANVSGTLTDNFNITQIIGFDPISGLPITITTPTSTTPLILPGTLSRPNRRHTLGYAAGLAPIHDDAERVRSWRMGNGAVAQPQGFEDQRQYGPYRRWPEILMASCRMAERRPRARGSPRPIT